MKKIICIIIILIIICSTVLADYIVPNRTKIYNQGTTSACVAFSMKTIIEMQTGEIISYNEIYKLRNRNELGMDIEDTLEELNIEYTTTTKDIENIKQGIENENVLIRILMDNSFYNCKSILNKSNSPTKEYHCMVLLGWKTIDNIEYWICQNSWGKSWGDKGLCHIPFDYENIEEYYIVKVNIKPLRESILALFNFLLEEVKR
jgi:C1A family cysteine protease